MKPKTYLINNQEIELYPIGVLAYEIGRQAQTVHKWEKKGVIPKALYRSETNRRLYTRAQIDALKSLLKKYNVRQGSEIPQDFIDELKVAFLDAK